MRSGPPRGEVPGLDTAPTLECGRPFTAPPGVAPQELGPPTLGKVICQFWSQSSMVDSNRTVGALLRSCSAPAMCCAAPGVL